MAPSVKRTAYKEVNMRRLVIILAVVFLFPALASAQGTMISGSIICEKPHEEHAIAVESRPHHSYAVNQTKCKWTEPWEIAGVASVEGVGTGVAEDHGNWVHSSGTYVDTMANGDKAYYSYEYNTKIEDGKTTISGHQWKLLGGTGKMKGVKGKGTCDVTPQEDGTANYVCKGEYTTAM